MLVPAFGLPAIGLLVNFQTRVLVRNLCSFVQTKVSKLSLCMVFMQTYNDGKINDLQTTIFMQTYSDGKIIVVTGDVLASKLEYSEATFFLSIHQPPVLLLIYRRRAS